MKPSSSTNRFAYQQNISNDKIPTFEELQTHLPPKHDHEYNHKRSWLTHILTNNMAVFPDFATQMGHHAHIIDVRPESEFAKTGIIPGSNWYPRDSEGYLEKIQRDFPSDALVAVVDYNGVHSRHIAGVLRSQYGFHFAAVLAGGVRLFKTFGFSVNRSTAEIKKNICTPLSIRSLESFRNFGSDDHTNVRDRGPYHSERRTLEQVAKHVEGDLLQWIKMGALSVHGRVSCIDGRGGNGCIGTPGGDMGEMVLILSTYEHLSGCDLTLPQIRYLFQHRLDTFGRFYLHTDETNATKALQHIKKEIIRDEGLITQIEDELQRNQVLPENWLKEFIHLTPEENHEDILEYLITPDCIGCGHLKLMVTRGDQYKVRPTLIKLLLRTFYEFSFWDETSDCDYVVLSGSHEECGVLSIEMHNEIRPYTKVPLISPSIPIQNGVKQMFVSHPTIMTFLRKQQCEWLVEAIEAANENALQELQQIIATTDPKKGPQQTPELVSFVTFSKNARKAFNPLVDLSADQHAAISLGVLATELPIYRLIFDAEHSRCKVDFMGFVESQSQPQSITTGTTPISIQANLSVPTIDTMGAIHEVDEVTSANNTTTTAAPTATITTQDHPKSTIETDTTSPSAPLSPLPEPTCTDEVISQHQKDIIFAQTPVNTTSHLSIDPSATPLNSSISFNIETPHHQFGNRALSSLPDESGCFADHHGMVIRSPFPTSSALPLVSPLPRQRASILGSPGLISPVLQQNDSAFTVTADLHLPSEVHHQILDDDESDVTQTPSSEDDKEPITKIVS